MSWCSSRVASKRGLDTQSAISYHFHGTQRACYIGENSRAINTCSNRDCHLCSLIKCSFQLKYVGQDNALGPGFYTSATSNKADGYAKNADIRSKKHAVLLGDVTTGRKEVVYDWDSDKDGPRSGYDSVSLVPGHSQSKKKRKPKWPETVVYREEAILPSVVIMYTRTGWKENS
ncbi:hypothetical protein BT69DRAFT_1225400 [Atractiella rhizophila]|nr:hypothetical protein BT69DRAFT_1225400 [Atractiella rhizophila]